MARIWLGWQDLNLRMPESKSGALTDLATAQHTLNMPSATQVEIGVDRGTRTLGL